MQLFSQFDNSQMRFIVAVLFPAFLILTFLLLLGQVLMLMVMLMLMLGGNADSYWDATADANIEVNDLQARSVGRGRWHNARKP